MTERDYKIWLNHLSKMRIMRKHILLEILGSAEAVAELGPGDVGHLEERGTLTPAEAEELVKDRPEEWLKKHNAKLDQLGVAVMVEGDPLYPTQLGFIPDPPICLYYKGSPELLLQPSMAVIGSRTPSLYGRETAGHFASHLAASGVVIVSGLAAGIDSEAHRAALTAGGSTIGVLGCGVEQCYPKENYGLYDRMCREGLVISEYEPGTNPYPANFPMRNRIISGLSRGVLVTEARRKSGTMITADAALEQGRSVYAVPGRIMDPLSAGTNHLIKDAARLAESPEEILDELFPELTKQGKKKREELTDEEAAILQLFSLEPMFMDDVIRKGRRGIAETISILQSLKKKRRIRETLPGYYILETKIYSKRKN